MVRLIAAIDNKRGMAKEGRIPWKLPKDVARFRELALAPGSNVLLGHTTFEQMGYLEGRNYFVVSHNELELPEGCTLVQDLDKFMAEFRGDLWDIGGAAIFNQTMKYADELYLTLINQDFNCDQFFPDYSSFKLDSSEGPFTENELSFTFQLYNRK